RLPSLSTYRRLRSTTLFRSINVCSPVASATSPVPFSIGASGDTHMRKVEVWVDGSKTAEQLNGFSGYTNLDKSIALANGSHNVRDRKSTRLNSSHTSSSYAV